MWHCSGLILLASWQQSSSWACKSWSSALRRFLSGTLEGLSSPICILHLYAYLLPNSNSAGEGLDDFQSYLKFLSLGVPLPNIHWFMLCSNRVFCPRRFWVVEAGERLPINSKQEEFPISQTQTSWALDATSQCWWLSISRAIIKASERSRFSWECVLINSCFLSNQQERKF